MKNSFDFQKKICKLYFSWFIFELQTR